MRHYAATVLDFGGCWLEDAGETLVAGFTREADVHAARLRNLVWEPDRLRVQACRCSLAQLLALQDRITADEQELRDRGVLVTSVGIRSDQGTVGVSLERLDDEIRTVLETRYGKNLLSLNEGTYELL